MSDENTLVNAVDAAESSLDSSYESNGQDDSAEQESAGQDSAPKESEAAQEQAAPAQPAAKTFTQDEVNAINKRERLAYERRLEEKMQEYQRSYGQQNQQANQHQQAQAELDPQAQIVYQAIQAYEQQKEQTRIAQESARQTDERNVEIQQIYEDEQRSLTAAAARYADYAEIVQDPTLPVSTPMRDAIALTGNAGDFWYNVAKNHRAELEKIRSLPQHRQVTEILRLEGRLSAGNPIKTSSAPQPMKAAQDSRAELANRSENGVDGAFLDDFKKFAG